MFTLICLPDIIVHFQDYCQVPVMMQEYELSELLHPIFGGGNVHHSDVL